MTRRTLTLREWHAEAEELFGADAWNWRFVCPSCGHVASTRDWKNAGATKGQVAFSCVGRALRTKNEAFSSGPTKSPCNYAGGGLFRINPVIVVFEDGGERQTFEFAKKEEPTTKGST